MKNVRLIPLVCLCLFILPSLRAPLAAQETGGRLTAALDAPASASQPAPGYVRLRRGLDFYEQGRWREAVAELRRAQAEAIDPELKAEALYWIALSEISAKDYAGAVQDMDRLELTAPESRRLQEVPYHKGRALYYLGRYEEALLLLKMYADSIGGIAPAGSDGAARKSAALYWIGECLYAMGQLENSRDIFTLIIERYPSSIKFEAANYRIALINQKMIESELLGLIQWSHEESLKTMEEYSQASQNARPGFWPYPLPHNPPLPAVPRCRRWILHHSRFCSIPPGSSGRIWIPRSQGYVRRGI